MRSKCLGGLLIAISLSPLLAADALAASALDPGSPHYRDPPPPISALLEQAPLPLVVSHASGQLLLVHREGLPPIESLSAPALQLAGVRINARTHASLVAPRYSGLTLLRPETREKVQLDLPRDAVVGFPQWAPDGSAFAFSLTRPQGIELWVADARQGAAVKLTGGVLNATLGAPCTWMPDSRRLLCRLVVDSAQASRARARGAVGPIVKEADGAGEPSRRGTAPAGAARDRMLDHFLGARLAYVDARSGELAAFGEPGVYPRVTPSPGGSHLLVVRAVPPYPPELPLGRLARSVEIWDSQGRRLRTIARLPALASDAAAPLMARPRAFVWRSVAPDRVVWAEPPSADASAGEASGGDRVLTLGQPFTEAPRELMRTRHRFSGLDWIEGSHLALVREYDRDTRHVRRWLLDSEATVPSPSLLWQRSVDDRYADPGTPLMRSNGLGQRVVVQHDGAIFLRGQGASPKGARPFLDRLSLATRSRERVWQSQPDAYETAAAVLSPSSGLLLLRRESAQESPHYALHSLARQQADVALDHRARPAPGYRQRLIRYRRDDDVELSALLYEPAGREPGERLPLVMWAYPRTFKDAAAASQTGASAHRFPFSGGFPALSVIPAAHGYAVLDLVAMPVIGDDGNDAFIAQVVANARAAVTAVVELGVADPDRIAIAGHSYGAFLAANLLAHTDLFRAGIAMSGSYNRTLTPFGFQTERRTLWEATDTYLNMSPYLYANRIRAPLLLIHGELDDHSGTPVMQSSRMFAAIRHHGGTARLVILPFEGHVYRARESVLHAAFEIVGWLDRHLRPRAVEPPALEQASADVVPVAVRVRH